MSTTAKTTSNRPGAEPAGFSAEERAAMSEGSAAMIVTLVAKAVS